MSKSPGVFSSGPGFLHRSVKTVIAYVASGKGS